MKETALKLLEKIENEGYKAYIVGGFVRDSLLKITTNDIDITTNATPQQLCKIFPDAILPSKEYGSVTLSVNQIHFEITTFRKEFSYEGNRRPTKVMYIQDLKEDLLRRDFIVNTLCMNSHGEIIDLLGGKKALEAKILETVKPSLESFEEDALRILRAIRFATLLDFSLSQEIEQAIYRKKGLLKNLSQERKKEELDKIFSSSNVQKGISYLLIYGLDEVLQLPKLKKLKHFPPSIGIWSFLEVEKQYPFSKNEEALMKSIRKASKAVLSELSLYENGLYASSVAGELVGISKKEIAQKYESLPIHSRRELAINGKDLMKAFKKEPGPYVHKTLSFLEEEVVKGHVANQKEALLSYCLEHQFMIG